MTIYFVDSSALVKRYINEIGSAWVLSLCDPALNNDILIAAITSVEIVAAITRRSSSISINATDATAACNQFRSDLQSEYQVVEFTESIINSAMALAETYGLRGYDAVQLATGCGIS
ncbi:MULTISPECIES: type II toxin-antitoxin system VapC family toxin [unclassified Microcoleus]|uniref:type II toxin-antitoxin system VapC family toxin n=1 Tax=unclassified Microcoleus TaxID=2642155 RepID=UPI002FD06137